jgi:GNAT superfamily N-acetyltransferase
VGIVTRPETLTEAHQCINFDCGNDVLNDWLKKRALKNQASGASRTFVIGNEDRVVGYYALSSGSVERLEAPKAIARNMPETIPVMLLARLAIELDSQGQGLGAALLKDALLRVLSVAKNVGVRAILVHAISEDAKRFYLGYGFQVSPIDSMTLVLPMKNIEALLQ